MFKLNRTTEYGLIAMRHMSRKSANEPAGVTSAREIADFYGLPFEIIAKTLQRLKETGLILSAQGARGGYSLLKPLEKISLGEFVELMEGPQSVVACADSAEFTGCQYDTKCEIKHVMSRLNSKVLKFLSGITLFELAGDLELSPRQSPLVEVLKEKEAQP